jgi:type VI secretion system protein VasJ
MDSQIVEWREIGTRPISAETPAGVSARYDPDFEQLEAEIQKLEGLAREPVDWAHVVALGRKIIEHRSKDILACSYAAMGLLELEGLPGLTKGLACMEGMISSYWPDLFPELKRVKARINALNWLETKADAAITQRAIKADDESAAVCESEVRSLATLLEERIPADPPDWTDLLHSLQELADRGPAGQSASAPELEREPPRESERDQITGPAPVETAEDARRFLSQTIEPVKRALGILRAAEPSVPAPYLMIRALTWSEIDELPPATEDRTMVPPPPGYLRDRFRDLVTTSAWKGLLDEVEERVTEFPFWLDLHRLSYQALTGLGKAYEAARTAVRMEAITFLMRLPGLAKLQFSDGLPFADDSTQRWISKDLFPAQAVTAAASLSPGAGEDSLAALRESARKLTSEGKQTEAITLVQDAIKTMPNERARFLAHLELVTLCLEAGQMKPALARLEVLDEQIRRFSLEAWEPDLCVEVLRLYWDALNELARATGW